MLDEVLKEIAEKFPLQRNEVYKIDEDERNAFTVLLHAISEVYSINAKEIVRCYEMFVNDTLEETKFFYDNGHYRYSTFEEVSEYMKSKNENYMRMYMIGLCISLFIWANHKEMRRDFINIIKSRKGGKYLEVGVGHGYYFSEAVSNSNFEHYSGVDIDEENIYMTNAIMEKYALKGKNYELKHIDFFNLEKTEIYDVIFCGEVLEHIENPEKFLQKFAELADNNTMIYLTTVINAPEVDHIYLFKNPDELYDLFDASGFKIDEMKIYLYKNKPLETCLKRKWPLTVSIIARKKQEDL